MKFNRGPRAPLVGVFLGSLALALSSEAQVTTLAATGISSNNGAATLNASVNPGGRPTGVLFVWGNTASYGATKAVPNVGAGSSPVPVNVTVTGLLSLTNYHFRAIATNALATNSGADLTFNTPFYPGSLSSPAIVNGSLRVTVSGTTNAAYGIYSSTNLLDWSLLAPGQFTYLASHPFQIDISTTSNASHLFYILR